MSKQLRGGDVKSHYEEAYNIIHSCGMLVIYDTNLTEMEKAHAISKLYHAQCYVMLEELEYNKIGDYLNG